MLIELHSQATTTAKIRAAIQASDEAARVLAERYGTTEPTVCKWRKRDIANAKFDPQTAPKQRQASSFPLFSPPSQAFRHVSPNIRR